MADSGESAPRIVLIPVDASENSERAFHWYVDNLRHKDDKLVIFHCHELHHSVYTALRSEEWKKIVNEHEEMLKALEEKYKAKCEAIQVPATIKVHGGSPGPEICNCAKESEATCIVMASRGHGTIRRTIMGSTSDFVLHHAHIPIIIVPKSK